jgi:hypothetical protein
MDFLSCTAVSVSGMSTEAIGVLVNAIYHGVTSLPIKKTEPSLLGQLGYDVTVNPAILIRPVAFRYCYKFCSKELFTPFYSNAFI